MNIHKSAGVHFIGIWGASGTGKSTLSKNLQRLLSDSAVLNIDQYLSPDLVDGSFNHVPPMGEPYLEGLDPNIWDQTLLREHLLLISGNKPAEMPIFDNRLRKRVGYNTFTPKSLVILDGAYSLENVVSSKILISIMLVVPFHDRFIRKLVRTYHVTGRRDLDESITRYITRTEPAAKFYENKYSMSVDVVAKGRSRPHEEFSQYMQEEWIGQEGYRDIVPKVAFGDLHEGERLTLYEYGDHSGAILMYLLNDRKVFDTRIDRKALSILLSYYD